jgi:hypothetical protein
VRFGFLALGLPQTGAACSSAEFEGVRLPLTGNVDDFKETGLGLRLDVGGE